MRDPAHPSTYPTGLKGEARRTYARGMAAAYLAASHNLAAASCPRASKACQEAARRWTKEAKR